MMEIKFQPQGVCAKQIIIDVDNGIVNNNWKYGSNQMKGNDP